MASLHAFVTNFQIVLMPTMNSNNLTSSFSPDTNDDIDIPGSVVIVYLAVAVWIGVAIQDFRKKRYWKTLIYGLTLALYLNVRYLFHGHGPGIKLFVGIYDVTDNIGLTIESGALPPPGLSSCLLNGTASSYIAEQNENECSLWNTNRYQYHPIWGAAFYNRFTVNPPKLRSLLLYIHIIFNTISFILIHIQSALMMKTKPDSVLQ